MKKNIWTIGHSNHSIGNFLLILKSFDIKILVDIRRYPGSRKFPHFNKEELEHSLGAEEIRYIHMEQLGGRRKPNPDSKNDRWQNEAFRGYADYMETPDFTNSVNELAQYAEMQSTAIMCSEVLWWQCHRSLVADYLKSSGWMVHHIMAKGKSKEHPYTPVAKIIQGKLDYGKDV